MAGVMKRYVSRLPLYCRFVLVGCIALGGWGVAGVAISRLCILSMVLVLFRRWWRAGHFPSRECGITPTMDGLHRRFVEFYHDSGSSARAEDLTDAMLMRVTLKDGQEIAFWDVGPRNATRVVLLVNGLGARIGIWAPLFEALHRASAASGYWKGCRVVIPEYRGQFASTPLAGEAHISVERSAQDVIALAESLGLKSATLMCWSTGVQVGLQVALERPDLIKAMILIQGFYPGEMLESVGQPLCMVPLVPRMFAYALSGLPTFMRRSGLRQMVYNFMGRHTRALEYVGKHLLWFFGTDLISPVAVRYMQDMMQSDAHFTAYCGYAMALSRHNISDRLPNIEAPALVVTGTPDFVTPARCSYDLAAMLGGRTTLVDDFGGSHYYIIEEPYKLAVQIMAFLEATQSTQSR